MRLYLVQLSARIAEFDLIYDIDLLVITRTQRTMDAATVAAAVNLPDK